MSLTTSPNSIKKMPAIPFLFTVFSEALPKNNHFDQLVTLKCISIACMPSYRLYTRKKPQNLGYYLNQCEKKRCLPIKLHKENPVAIRERLAFNFITEKLYYKAFETSFLEIWTTFCKHIFKMCVLQSLVYYTRKVLYIMV